MADFNDSYTAVLLRQPFFGQLLTKYKIEQTTTIPTLAVSMTTISYNPDYFAELTDLQGIFAITHEVMHGVYAHLVEMDMYAQSGIGPDGKPYDQMKYNKACDYVINDLLVQNQIGEIRQSWLHDSAYSYSMIPADIYAMLPDQPPGGAGDPNGGGQDQHQSEGASGGADEAPAISATDVLSAAENAKALGVLPMGLDRIIAEAKRPRTSPWARLRKAWYQAISGKDTATWRRVNRQMMARGVIMPGRTGVASGPVGVVVDTSGSIGEEMLALFGAHMGAILTDAKPKLIHVYWVDAKVHRHDTIRSGAELSTLLKKPVPGGGGTDMPKGIAAAVKDRCEAVVVLTDMCTPFGPKIKQPLIWGAVGSKAVAPHGVTVHLT